MEQLNASKYRYDLDGLRGIAIAFVVLFHVFVGRVSGGVDVFLLLSGYFFLGAAMRRGKAPTSTPGGHSGVPSDAWCPCSLLS